MLVKNVVITVIDVQVLVIVHNANKLIHKGREQVVNVLMNIMMMELTYNANNVAQTVYNAVIQAIVQLAKQQILLEQELIVNVQQDILIME